MFCVYREVFPESRNDGLNSCSCAFFKAMGLDRHVRKVGKYIKGWFVVFGEPLNLIKAYFETDIECALQDLLLNYVVDFVLSIPAEGRLDAPGMSR